MLCRHSFNMQPQHYCFYVLLVLQPVRGQSALGWFINYNNNTEKCTHVMYSVTYVLFTAMLRIYLTICTTLLYYNSYCN